MVKDRVKGRAVLRVLARLRFTLALEIAVLVVALRLRLFDPGQGELWLEREGFGWASLREGRVSTLFTSIFLVEGPSQWLRIAVLLAWAPGAYEWRRGLWRCALVYVLTNTLGCLGAAGVQAVCARSFSSTSSFASLRDVGASAGAFGCAAAFAVTLTGGWRMRVLVGLSGCVALKAILFPALLSDLTHGIALALGSLMGLFLEKSGPTSRT